MIILGNMLPGSTVV